MAGKPRMDDMQLRDFIRRVSERLPTAMRLAFRRKVVADASARLVRALKPYAPKRTGRLMRSIGTRPYTKWAIRFVGARLPEGAAGHLVDRGTHRRETRQGYNRGRVAAVNWFEKALQTGGRNAVNLMEASVRKRADDQFRKLAKR